MYFERMSINEYAKVIKEVTGQKVVSVTFLKPESLAETFVGKIISVEIECDMLNTIFKKDGCRAKSFTLMAYTIFEGTQAGKKMLGEKYQTKYRKAMFEALKKIDGAMAEDYKNQYADYKKMQLEDGEKF